MKFLQRSAPVVSLIRSGQGRMEGRLAQTLTKIFGSPGIVRPGKLEISRPFAPLTRRSFSFGIWVAAITLFFVTGTQALDVNRGENIADAAEQLIGEIRETHYQHRTNAIQSAGIYDMDCSGFVDFLLKRIAPEQYADLPIEPGHTRPRATVYFALFNDLPQNARRGWKSINRLVDAQRGDIIAWALTASTQKPADTGHVVIVAASPVMTNQRDYRVAVYDSSGIHHDDDSRPKSTTGIGKGVITFEVDGQGVPVGFQFNSQAHFHLEPIAIGRLVQ